MDVKSFYENEFAYSEVQRFEDYERNILLAKISKKYFRKGKNLLDLGCNDGVVADYFAKQGHFVTGMDISEKALNFAHRRGSFKTIQGDIEKKLPFSPAEFDIVFWGDNVEHLFHPLSVLTEINRILKKNGLLVLSTPNMAWIVNRIYFLLFGIPRRTEGHTNPPWHWEHIRFFNKKTMYNFLREGGFEVEGFFSCDRRKFLNSLARICPSLFGSIMIVVARKSD